MPHPFFDNPIYPWHRDDAIAFHKELYTLIRDSGAITLRYQSCRGEIPLNVNQRPDLIWKDALDGLAQVGNGVNRLCGALAKDFSTLKPFLKVIDAVVNAEEDVMLQKIADDVLVLDRDNLRDQLRLLESDSHPKKVLLVRGEARSGKSHGRYLFEHLARCQNAKAVYLCAGLVFSVDDIVDELLATLGAPKEGKPPRDTTTDAWYAAVCRSLLREASQRNQKLWLAVDDLGQDSDGAPLLDEEIRKFCEQLAHCTLNPAYRQWFRLMLIGYPDGPTPTRWKKDFWTEDRVRESDIQKKEIEVFLRRWAAQANLTMLEEDIRKKAEDLINTVDDPGADQSSSRLQRIHDAILNILRSLLTSP